MSVSEMARQSVVRHGYTLGEIDHMVRAAAFGPRASRFVDPDDRKEAAWFAIVEMLFEAVDERPTRPTLINAGVDAINYESRRIRSTHGLTNDFSDGPAFARYWFPHIKGDHDFTDGVVERLALPQVLAALTDDEHAVLIALATYDDHHRAAEALGIGFSTFGARLAAARAHAQAVWVAPETPRRTGRAGETDEACRYGHSRAEHSVRRPNGTWKCKACSRASDRRRAARNGGSWRSPEANARRAAAAREQRARAKGQPEAASTSP